jgi:hypothetical protein
MLKKNGTQIIIDVWPFLPSIFENSTPAAWPHPPGKAYFPCLALFYWNDANDNAFWINEMTTAMSHIRKVALQEKCTENDYPYYMNTSLDTRPVQEIYRHNLDNLSDVRTKYDPNDVMGNAAGFRIPLSKRPPPSTAVSDKFDLKLDVFVTGTFLDIDIATSELYFQPVQRRQAKFSLLHSSQPLTMVFGSQ